MNRNIELRRMCVHCGVNYLQGNAHWCGFCLRDARENHGVCKFCHKDISEFANCWQVRREMDKARVHDEMPVEYTCPSCKEFNGELNLMETVELYVSPGERRLRMVCTVCETVLVQNFTIFRPPPKKGTTRNYE